MVTTRLFRAAAVTAGLAVILAISSCALTSDLSGSLVGRVLISGSFQPIASAQIECEGVTAVSGADGSYSMEGIPPGDHVVYAYASGFEEYSEVVNIEEDTVHDIHMNVYVAPARLFGYVSHATLGAVEGATVQIGDLAVVTDSEGYYEFPNVLQTTYSMTVSRDGYRSVTRNVYVASANFRFDVAIKKLATATLAVIADTGVREHSPDTNFGDAPDYELTNNGFVHNRFVVKTELGVEVTAEPVLATLRLYNAIEEGAGEARTILVGRILLSWDEMTLTWNYPLQTTGATTAQGTYEERWYEINVTGYFRDWLVDDESNHGLLVDTTVDHEADRFTFASREYPEEDKRPHVVLDYAW